MSSELTIQPMLIQRLLSFFELLHCLKFLALQFVLKGLKGKQEHYSLSYSNVHLFTAQRSAHELPMVEKQDMDSCSALGGQQMILTGQNFSADSKVIFTEKTHGE